jgi:hypothetical protein
MKLVIVHRQYVFSMLQRIIAITSIQKMLYKRIYKSNQELENLMT